MHTRKRLLLLGVAAAALSACGSAANADTIAYDTAFGTPGNQSWTGALGLDFNVTSTITVTRLGAFDDMSDGLKSDITVGIFQRNGDGTGTLIASTTLDTGTGTLEGGNRFVDVTDFNLTPGQYSVVAVGYGTDEENYNTYGVGPNPLSTTNTTSGTITTLNQWRYAGEGSGFVYPLITGSDITPTRFDAGTFAYVVPVPPAVLGGAALLGLSGGAGWLRRRRLTAL